MNYGDWRPETSEHDQWMALFLAPFVALWPRPETVQVVQVASIALAAPLLYEAGRKFGAGAAGAAIVCAAYLVSPSSQAFAYGDFVPLDFVPLLGFGLALAVKSRSLVWTLILVQLLTGTKEDVGLFVLWFALAGAILYDRRLGLTAASLCLVNLAAYQLAERFTGVSFVHPNYVLHDPEWPKQLAFFIEVLAPFAFAPLALGWRIVLAAPLLAELMFAQHWAVPLFQAGVYYTIPLVTLIAVASAYAVAKRPIFARFIPATALVMALFFNVTVLHAGRHPFSADPKYAVARAWALTDRQVQFPCEDQSAWVVASPDTNAQLLGCDPHARLHRNRPAWADVPLFSTAAWTHGP
jgi:uncharacterized membrane protein